MPEGGESDANLEPIKSIFITYGICSILLVPLQRGFAEGLVYGVEVMD